MKKYLLIYNIETSKFGNAETRKTELHQSYFHAPTDGRAFEIADLMMKAVADYSFPKSDGHVRCIGTMVCLQIA